MSNIISVFLKDLNDSSSSKTSAEFLFCSSLHRLHMNRLGELCFAGDQRQHRNVSSVKADRKTNQVLSNTTETAFMAGYC